MADVSLLKFHPEECLWTSLMITPHWFGIWLGAVRQQSITWANVDPDLCRHMPSLGHSELIAKVIKPIVQEHRPWYVITNLPFLCVHITGIHYLVGYCWAKFSVFSCLRLRQRPVTYLITVSDWTMSCQPGRHVVVTANSLVRLVNLTYCNPCSWWLIRSKFHSNM